MCETRSKTEIWLVGFTSSEMLGSKLPTARQVLSYLFHIIKQTKPKTSVSDASLTVAKSVINYWQKAAIPTKHQGDVKKKICELYTEWEHVKKKKAERLNHNYLK